MSGDRTDLFEQADPAASRRTTLRRSMLTAGVAVPAALALDAALNAVPAGADPTVQASEVELDPCPLVNVTSTNVQGGIAELDNEVTLAATNANNASVDLTAGIGADVLASPGNPPIVPPTLVLSAARSFVPSLGMVTGETTEPFSPIAGKLLLPDLTAAVVDLSFAVLGDVPFTVELVDQDDEPLVEFSIANDEYTAIQIRNLSRSTEFLETDLLTGTISAASQSGASDMPPYPLLKSTVVTAIGLVITPSTAPFMQVASTRLWGSASKSVESVA